MLLQRLGGTNNTLSPWKARDLIKEVANFLTKQIYFADSFELSSHYDQALILTK
jgi:hypothetical protein